MGTLSGNLRDEGYEPTGKESPFDEDGQLWTKGYELVCDETGIVIRKDGSDSSFRGERPSPKTYRYRNSGRVILVGGFTSNYFDDDGLAL